MCMNKSDTKLKRWTIYADPALIDEFRHLASEHKRSLNSELIWALEQYAKQEKRKRKRDTDQESL
jgi:hypothetical protein